uniref:heme attachment to plastid cytochrome c n=1 Tax=Parallela transversalis TaxID=163324 RepID=UPI0010C4A311|nr:heme attachment to plastid cytochrome c [Parallela transversalis]AYQ22917.1 heme attachment to plastid cytochrome c [Parallela transversalis]
MPIKIENFLANSSFILIFFSMIFYWLHSVFFLSSKTAIMKDYKAETSGDVLTYVTNEVLTDKIRPIKIKLSGDKSQKLSFANLAKFFMTLSQFSLMGLLLWRWVESGHFPISNLYEACIFLSWSFTFLGLGLEKFTQNSFLGSIIAPCALLTNTFASFSLPEEMQKSSALVPALQSNWLMMHVSLMILSYAALIFGSLLAIAFLVIVKFPLETFVKSEESSREEKTRDKTREFNRILLTGLNPNLERFAQTLDNLSYRVLGIGFPLLTIGILSGAVWANEAWGSYWSWDPKETWALLTWLVFAIYLHTRLNKGWQGEKPALIASLGFLTVWICFLGVNLLGEGLHSYGWFNAQS